MSHEYIFFADKSSSEIETFKLLWHEVETALGNLSCSRGDHGIALVVTKLPGTVNGSPYTSSAEEACKSCL